MLLTRECVKQSTDGGDAASVRGAAGTDVDPPATIADRVRLAGSALAVGLGVGAAGVPIGLLALGSLRAAGDTVFALGLLAFGFGTLGWSGSALAGRGAEAMQAHIAGESDWTERRSRRAMARIGWFGVGVMVSAVSLGTALALL